MHPIKAHGLTCVQLAEVFSDPLPHRLSCSLFSPSLWAWHFWRPVLLLKTELKKPLNASVFSMPCLTRAPAPLSSQPAFPRSSFCLPYFCIFVIFKVLESDGELTWRLTQGHSVPQASSAECTCPTICSREDLEPTANKVISTSSIADTSQDQSHRNLLVSRPILVQKGL